MCEEKPLDVRRKYAQNRMCHDRHDQHDNLELRPEALSLLLVVEDAGLQEMRLVWAMSRRWEVRIFLLRFFRQGLTSRRESLFHV